MDYSMLYVLGIVGYVVGLVFLVRYLRMKKYFTKDDMIVALEILNLSFNIVDELGIKMDLKQEKYVKNIAEIVKESLKVAIDTYDNSDKIQEYAYMHALTLCEKIGLKITENRRNIIKQLINATLTNNNLDKIS